MSLRTPFPEKELVLEVSANKKARFYVRKTQEFLRYNFGDENDPSNWEDKKFVQPKGLTDRSPFESKLQRTVVLVGRGATLQKAVAIAETLKREVSNVAQSTQICWFSSENKGSGLVQKEAGSGRRLIPSIRITLWRSERTGYGSRESVNAPIFQEPVHEQVRLDMVRFAEGQL
ncbi:hypothetical protein CCYA_CCYA01G0300 [Cyanidiococcus yangmingshanensis]|nr:hypothetical protein CCYA_CCYA01G0300 [Cyanidiococcus yangmingshanensis]